MYFFFSVLREDSGKKNIHYILSSLFFQPDTYFSKNPLKNFIKVDKHDRGDYQYNQNHGHD